MKKQLLAKGALALFFGLTVSSNSFAQTNTNNNTFDANSVAAKEKSYYEAIPHRKSNLPVKMNVSSQPEMILWSEDFANGFAGSTNGAWTTGGLNANFVQYDTDGPDNLLQFGWGPLPSATPGNGFAIFDWYDRFPDPNGFATSPVEGTLTSPVIDLTGQTDVQIEWFHQTFWCCAIDFEILLEISTDGGNSFPNSIRVNEDFDRNDRHWDLGQGYEQRFKIGQYIAADPSNVVIRFNWTSTTADQNGQFATAYFWMLDDITISTVPVNSLEFTVASDGAPAHDIIFNGDGSASKHGIMGVDQVTPINFDSNVLNYGTATQTNIQLEVEIWDDQGTLITTLTSAATNVTAAEGDTITYQDLFTGQWPANLGTGRYDYVFKINTDSSNVSSFESQIDTISSFVATDLHSIDWNQFTNNFGTNELGDDGSAVASRLFFPNPTPGAPGNEVYIHSVDLRLSTQSTAGGDVVVELRAAEPNIDLTVGFSNPAIATRTHTITAAEVGSTATINFEDSVFNAGTGLWDRFGTELPDTGNYMVVVNMFSNAGASPIQLANSQTITQPGFASLMFDVDQARWFTGFANSLTFNAPWIRARLDTTPAPNIGQREFSAFEFDVFPNPVTGGQFDITVSEGGAYEVSIMNTLGQFVQTESFNINGSEKASVNVSSLAKGIYFVNLKSAKGVESTRITIK